MVARSVLSDPAEVAASPDHANAIVAERKNAADEQHTVARPWVGGR